jgi:DNA-binding response OmpR family regulator
MLLMDATQSTEPLKDQAALSLLLIDDDAELGNMMKEFFAQVGYQLDCAYSGREGLDRALKCPYDLIILDVMLPMINGFTVLQQLRRRKTVPVIMLTARVQRRDRIMGLNSGADDYLAKPFDPDELLARIRAVLRRSGRLDTLLESVKSFADVQVDFQTRQVWSGGRIVDLTALEFDILNLLISAEGRVVTRDEITASLLERDASPYDRALDVHISHLRRKLESGGALIHTVRGIGYVFAAKGFKE